jgi:hypothetical protein
LASGNGAALAAAKATLAIRVAIVTIVFFIISSRERQLLCLFLCLFSLRFAAGAQNTPAPSPSQDFQVSFIVLALTNLMIFRARK